ncbi:MAG: hypothetical protein QG608_2037 [Actinomycetota bacterium]|nr:hypothetical protein [Actinomycetota bacterium]
MERYLGLSFPSSDGVLRRTAFCGFILTTAFMVCAGCSSRPSGSPESKSAVLSGEAVDLVVSSVRFSDQQRILDKASTILERQCLNRKGIVTQVLEESSVHLFSDGFLSPLDLIPQRKIYGYGILNQTEQDPQSENNGSEDATNSSTSARSDAALENSKNSESDSVASIVLSDGREVSYLDETCLADARRQLGGNDLPTWIQMDNEPQALSSTVGRKTSEDPAHAAIMKEWSKCMLAKGYGYATPDEAVNYFKKLADSGSISDEARERERSVAVIDAQCAHDGSVPTRINKLMEYHSHDLPASAQATLNRLAAYRSTAVERAQQVILSNE